MTQERWIPCPAPAVSDTIRWREPIWAKPNKPRGKPDQIGEQAVTATVTSVGETVELQVIAAKRLSIAAGAEDTPSKINAGDMIRRKLSSIKMGTCQKLAKED